jgi:hypothetical protein
MIPAHFGSLAAMNHVSCQTAGRSIVRLKGQTLLKQAENKALQRPSAPQPEGLASVEPDKEPPDEINHPTEKLNPAKQGASASFSPSARGFSLWRLWR